jgi:uncharacterized protein (DUF983 family)
MAEETFAQFKEGYSEALQRTSGSVALRMVEESNRDPYALARTMEAVLRMARLSKPQVVRPAWPPQKDKSGVSKPVVFHITPFADEFTEQSMSAERVCEACGYQYIRHDMTDDPRIIRSLWGWLISADRIIADVTSANPNVALELGIAHVIGKDVLLVAQEPVKAHLFPSLLHVKVTKYTPGDDSFTSVVKNRLKEK